MTTILSDRNQAQLAANSKGVSIGATSRSL